jgi:hypothetical protein
VLDLFRIIFRRHQPEPFEIEIYDRQKRMAEDARRRLAIAIDREEEVNRLLNIVPQRGPTE